MFSNFPAKIAKSWQGGFTFNLNNVILIAMKKTGLFSTFLLLLVTMTQAGALRIGAFAGYFATADNNFKQVYSQGDLIYGAKLGVRIGNGFSIWLAGAQFQTEAETTLLQDPTQLTINPVDLSLRYTFLLGAFNPYIEGGYTYIYFKEESTIGNTKGEGKGYFLCAGGEIKFSSHFSIDIGVKYSRAEVKPTGFDVQLGGAQAGICLILTL